MVRRPFAGQNKASLAQGDRFKDMSPQLDSLFTPVWWSADRPKDGRCGKYGTFGVDTGLVECRGEDATRTGHGEWRKTPLFDRFVQFIPSLFGIGKVTRH